MDGSRSIQRRVTSQKPEEKLVAQVKNAPPKRRQVVESKIIDNKKKKAKAEVKSKTAKAEQKKRKQKISTETEDEDDEAKRKKKQKRVGSSSISADKAMSDTDSEKEDDDMDNTTTNVESDPEDDPMNHVDNDLRHLDDDAILRIFYNRAQTCPQDVIDIVVQRTKNWFSLSTPIPVDIILQAREDSRKVCATIEGMWSVPDIRTFIKAHKTTENKVEEKELFDEQTWDEIAALLRGYLAD
ncbi:hypothetical protein EKO04_010216 [Ascochyta lentis]|uniref:Uncharacterized protein n=1 Tax=Ascochyta lentis TaxID=205686 RepID=A0A8H7IVT6_9PLEO|nr:hypothetical protein EKO04_010216 [Ascochyta lentis]